MGLDERLLPNLTWLASDARAVRRPRAAARRAFSSEARARAFLSGAVLVRVGDRSASQRLSVFL